jgi:hypothetical protein
MWRWPASASGSSDRRFTAWFKTGSMTRKFSTAARGLPGKFTISVLPRIPAVARDSIACGVTSRLEARMASANPGAARSITALVASGVTSLGLNPVPPLVNRMSSSPESAHAVSVLFNMGRSSGTISFWEIIHPCAVTSSSIAGPDRSGRSPREDRSETVRIPIRKVVFPSILLEIFSKYLYV